MFEITMEISFYTSAESAEALVTELNSYAIGFVDALKATLFGTFGTNKVVILVSDIDMADAERLLSALQVWIYGVGGSVWGVSFKRTAPLELK